MSNQSARAVALEVAIDSNRYWAGQKGGDVGKELNTIADEQQAELDQLTNSGDKPESIKEEAPVSPISFAVTSSSKFSKPKLLGDGEALTSSDYTLEWNDPKPAASRRYYFFVNDAAQPSSVVPPGMRYAITGLPSDGSQVKISMSWTDDGEAPLSDPSKVIEINVTAFTGTTTAPTDNCPQYDEMLGRLASAISSHQGRNHRVVNDHNGRVVTDSGYFNYEAFDGLDAAWEATGDQSYIQEMMTMASLYIDAGYDADGDGYHDWYSTNQANFNDYHYEWRAAAGLGVLLTRFIDNPELALSTTANKNKLGEWLRDHVWDKWDSNNSPNGQNYNDLTNATHMLSRMIPVTIALEKFYGGTSSGTPGRSYAAWLNTGALNSLEDHILHPSNQTNGACNIWGRVVPAPGGDVGGSVTPGSNDVPHAMDIVIGMLFAAKHGWLGNPDAVRSCLTKALNDVIWDGAGFKFRVDGQASSTAYSKSPEGWLRLLEYDKTNFQAFITWALANSDVGSNSFPTRISVWSHLLTACKGSTAPVVSNPTTNSTPTLNAFNPTSSSGTLTWTDDNPPATRNYDIAVDGADQGQSVVNVKSYNLTGLPTDGQSHEIILSYWDNGDLTNIKTVNITFTAFQQQVSSLRTGLTVLANPSSDIPRGSFDNNDWVAMMGQSIVSASGNQYIEAGTYDGRRGIEVQMAPVTGQTVGSTRSEMYRALPANSKTLRIAQRMRFPAGSTLPSQNNRHTAKVGFGMRTQQNASGGNHNPAGFSIRPTLRGLGDGRAGMDAYTYISTTPNSGQIYGEENHFVNADGSRWEVPEDVWFDMVMDYTLNSSTGASDGSCKAYIDGVEKYSRTGMQYYSAGAGVIDWLSMVAFWGGNDETWRPANTSLMQISDVAIGSVP